MQALIKAKLILPLITTVLLVIGMTVPFSITILHSHAATVSSQALWRVVPSPNAGTSENYLSSVNGSSASDIWAVGCFVDDTDCQALIEHWDGASWSIVSSPNVGASKTVLRGVVSLSTNNAWAVGSYDISSSGPDRPLIEHWDGTSWSMVPSTNAGINGNSLNGIVALSANDVWAVGAGSGGSLIEHWDGASWSVVPSPNIGNYLASITAVSANDIWAVGGDSNSNAGSNQTLIEHWDGTSWSVVPSPDNGSYGSSLSGVSAISANDIWATGSYALTSSGPNRTLIEHWDGTSWSMVPSLDPGSYTDSLSEVVALSTSDVWTVGDESNSSSPEQALIEHWDGTSWSVVPNTNPAESSFSQLMGVTSVSSSDVWAVGAYSNSNSNCAGDCQTLIEQYYAPSSISKLTNPSPDPHTISTSSPVSKKMPASSALGQLGQAIAV